jgi:hypothetical protein
MEERYSQDSAWEKTTAEGSISHYNAELLRKKNYALRSAAALGHADKVQRALDEGAQISSRDQAGRTAAYFAIKNGHAKCLEILLTSGLDTDNEGLELTQLAVQQLMSTSEDKVELHQSLEQCLQSLERCGATTNEEIAMLKQVAEEESSPQYLAMYAVRNDDDVSGLQEAINNGADVNATNEKGETLADVAISSNRFQCFEFLLSQNFDVKKYGPKLIANIKAQIKIYEENKDFFDTNFLDSQDLHFKYQTCIEMLEATTDHPLKAVETKPGLSVLEKLIQANSALDQLREEKQQELPDHEVTRQQSETQRSGAGQESLTEFICAYDTGVFITAGGFKRPNFGLYDPIVRTWEVGKNSCVGQFNTTMEIGSSNAMQQVPAPRGLCKISDNCVAVSYDVNWVQFYNPKTQEVVAKIDLSANPSTSPRTSPRSSQRASPRNSLRAMLSPRASILGPKVFVNEDKKTSQDLPVSQRTRAGSFNSLGKMPRPTVSLPPLAAKPNVSVDMCTLYEDKSVFSTTFENSVKLWDVERTLALAVFKDERASTLLKIVPVANYSLLGLDNAGNAFIWDTRGKTKAASATLSCYKKPHIKLNPCVVSLPSMNLIAIGYKGDNGVGGDHIRTYNLSKLQQENVVHDKDIPNTTFAAPFCAFGENALAVTTNTTVQQNFPRKGQNNFVAGTLIGIYKPGNHKLRFVDLLTQEATERTTSPPEVVSMQKVAEHVIAVGVRSDKGNTLKLSRTNVREYTRDNHNKDTIMVTSRLQK